MFAEACYQPCIPKSISHHSLWTSSESTTRRESSRSSDLSTKIRNDTNRSHNNLPLNKVHSSSKSLELPDSSGRRLTRDRAFFSLDSDIPGQGKKNGQYTVDGRGRVLMTQKAAAFARAIYNVSFEPGDRCVSQHGVFV